METKEKIFINTFELLGLPIKKVEEKSSIHYACYEILNGATVVFDSNGEVEDFYIGD